MDDRCPVCRFAPGDWVRRDALRTAAHVANWWDRLTDGLPGPVPGITAGVRDASIEAAARATSLLEADDLTAGVEALHDALHAVHEGGRAVAAAGAGAARQCGTVAQLNVSGGGVPKLPVGEAVVGWRGLEGDVQAERKHHGRPWQALCLWSGDVIERLAAEGHPLAFGSAGENVTVVGVDWASIRTGTILAIGEVEAEISLDAVPCRKNARWFAGGDYRRMAVDREPGVTRWYAWVRRPGVVRTGDPVEVEP